MHWFKHYSNASDNRAMNHLMDEFGPQGYAWFFLLLELCAEKWDGKSEPKFTFHQRTVRQKLRTSLGKVQLFLERSQTLGQLSFNFSEKEFEINIPKLLEIKSSRDVVKNSKGPIKSRVDENRIDKSRVDKREENLEIEEKLVESWNSLDIKQHKLSESNLKKVQKKLEKRLGENSLDEILQAMKNYQEALTLGWFSYKWSLWDFLSRENANKFYPEEYVKENFMDANSEQVKFNNMKDRVNPYAG